MATGKIIEGIRKGAQKALEDKVFDEEESYYAEEAYVEAKQRSDILAQEVAALKQGNELRDVLAQFMMIFIVVWTLFIGAILCKVAEGKYQLSDSVIITLITTTTANYVTVLVIIAKYLFNPVNRAQELLGRRR